jgi:hypothetical protein
VKLKVGVGRICGRWGDGGRGCMAKAPVDERRPEGAGLFDAAIVIGNGKGAGVRRSTSTDATTGRSNSTGVLALGRLTVSGMGPTRVASSEAPSKSPIPFIGGRILGRPLTGHQPRLKVPVAMLHRNRAGHRCNLLDENAGGRGYSETMLRRSPR